MLNSKFSQKLSSPTISKVFMKSALQVQNSIHIPNFLLLQHTLTSYFSPPMPFSLPSSSIYNF